MFRGLLKIFRVFSRNERFAFGGAALIFILSLLFLIVGLINKNTILAPVYGGEYREGVLGQPTFVNPVLVATGDPDRDLSELLFSNILDLADSYKTSADGRTWTIRLKDNIFWDDKEPITSDDVIFTIQTIENPDSRSPLYPAWQGIDARRVSERELSLVLPTPYSFFLANLKDLRPIPKHIFGNLPAANIRLSNYNLEPIGSGPYKFDSFQKKNDGFVSEYNLTRSDNYFGDKPYIDNFSLHFYGDQSALIQALNTGEVDGAGGLPEAVLEKIRVSHQTFYVGMPRYYAVFFNQYSSPALRDKNVRLALNYAVDKNKIVEQVFAGRASRVSGPLLPGMEGYAPKVYPQDEFSLDKASQILDVNGWQPGKDGIRSKTFTLSVPRGVSNTTSTRLEFELVVPETPFLAEAARLVALDWSKLGVKTNIIVMAAGDLNDKVLKTRNYEMLIFGNIFGNNPDIFSFWDSSEKFYPGLNLALYDNQSADALIEAARREVNPEARKLDFASLQSVIIGDAPAVFLFSPYYIYVAPPRLGGFKPDFLPLPGDRFRNISGWYVKTARVFR